MSVGDLEGEVKRLRAGLEKIARDGDALDCVIEARHTLWPPGSNTERLASPNAKVRRIAELEELIREYGSHQSWRCDHPPHYYLVNPPTDDCACGLVKQYRALGLDPDTAGPAANA